MLAARRPVGCWCQNPFPISRDGAAPFNVLFLCVVFFVPELEEGFALWRASPFSIKYVQGALRLTVRTTTPPRHVEVVCRVWDWVL